MYFKACDGIICIYNIVNRHSFDNVEDWVNNIKDSISDESKYIIYLIGNKSDLTEYGGKEREVTEEEAKKKCEEFNMIWGGEINIKDIKLGELEDVMEKLVKYIYDKVGIKEDKIKISKKIRNYKKKDKKIFYHFLLIKI